MKIKEKEKEKEKEKYIDFLEPVLTGKHNIKIYKNQLNQIYFFFFLV